MEHHKIKQMRLTLLILAFAFLPQSTGNEISISYSHVEDLIMIDNPSYPQWNKEKQEEIKRVYKYSYKK